MTNGEVIETLNSLKDYYNDKNEDSYVGFDYNDNEALDLAIKALEQQPCKDWLSTFNTESATECFTAVQRLKESIK